MSGLVHGHHTLSAMVEKISLHLAIVKKPMATDINHHLCEKLNFIQNVLPFVHQGRRRSVEKAIS